MPHQHQLLVRYFSSLAYFFNPVSFIIIPNCKLVCFFVFSVTYHVRRNFGLLSVSLYVFLDTNWRSIKIPNRAVSLHFFCTNINIYIYSFYLPTSFFKNDIFLLCLLNHCCCLVAMSFPTFWQPQGL